VVASAFRPPHPKTPDASGAAGLWRLFMTHLGRGGRMAHHAAYERADGARPQRHLAKGATGGDGDNVAASGARWWGCSHRPRA
jgi:hypothetical protein